MPRVVPPEVLDKLARIIARSPEGIGIDALSHSLKPRVPRSDLRRFVETVLAELENLYKGNITRYGLKLSEYLAWRKDVSAESRDKRVSRNQA